MGYGTFLPIAFSRAVGKGGRARSASRVEMVSAGKLRGFLAWCEMELKIPISLIDNFLIWLGWYVQKYPDLSYSLDTWKLKVTKVRKPMGATLNEKPNTAL